MASLQIKDHMTEVVVTVAPTDALAEAREKMTLHAVRHLPVIRDGVLVGMVSLGDLYVMEALVAADPEETQVENAMSMELYVVSPDTLLQTVVAEMAQRGLGSAIVVDQGLPIGIFTSTDACRVLAAVLAAGDRA